MKPLPASLPSKELNQRGFDLYEAFRPAVPAEARGWGTEGELDLDRIVALANDPGDGS